MRLRGPIVIDTDVFSADLVRQAELAELYAPLTARGACDQAIVPGGATHWLAKPRTVASRSK